MTLRLMQLMQPDIHYNDIIMSAMAFQITSLMSVYSTGYSRRRSLKISKLRVTGVWAGNSPVKQRASNAENVSIWWRHHISIASYAKNLLQITIYCKIEIEWTNVMLGILRNTSNVTLAISSDYGCSTAFLASVSTKNLSTVGIIDHVT